jgi:hypothetical protein
MSGELAAPAGARARQRRQARITANVVKRIRILKVSMITHSALERAR